jgi:flagella basal body P-ring formation protein FlgA
MRRSLAHALALLLMLPAGRVHAALLRPYTEITAGTVRLGDLFDDLGNTPDRLLGKAPAPGEKIVVEAPQLAAIARDFGVAWRPSTGDERSVLQRRGQAVPAAQVHDCLLKALRLAGAPADGDVLMPAFEPPTVGAGTTPKLEATQLSFDGESGRFTTLLVVQDGEGDVPTLRLSGQVVSMRDAATLTRHLSVGSVVTADDVRPMRVRTATLHGQTPLLAPQAVGLSVKHDVAPGRPIMAGDLVRPEMVARGATVRMTLDTSGLALSAIGVAMEAGAIGDHIRVQNPSSHAIVVGEVTGSGTVRVAPSVSLAAAQ